MNYLNEKCVFAGSFDPVTYGHLDIITRAANMFEKLIVVVAGYQYRKAHDQRKDKSKNFFHDVSLI